MIEFSWTLAFSALFVVALFLAIVEAFWRQTVNDASFVMIFLTGLLAFLAKVF